MAVEKASLDVIVQPPERFMFASQPDTQVSCLIIVLLRGLFMSVYKEDNSMNTHKVSIGIDVSKHHLDVYSEAQKKNLRFDNSTSGIKRLRAFIQAQPSLWRIVLEPSGGYEQQVFSTLVSERYPVSLVPAQWVRSFARASGLSAKTDRIDAQLLANYGSTMDPCVNQSLNALHAKLQSLIDRRAQIVEMIRSEGNRLEKSPSKEIIKWINVHLETLKQQLSEIEKVIKETLNDEHYKAIMNILTEVPGIGVTTAATLLATLPELGKLSKKKIARMVGIAPITKESGTFKGQAHIGGGRTKARGSLYMATLTAARYNPVIKQFYESLRGKGKKAKVALIACMHKLLGILNARLLRYFEGLPVY